MLYNGCTGIYKFGNNAYPRRIRHRSNLGHFFQGKKVRLMSQKIRYLCPVVVTSIDCDHSVSTVVLISILKKKTGVSSMLPICPER